MESYIEQVVKLNVPRFIQAIKERGGVQQEEWDWIREGYCEEKKSITGFNALEDLFSNFDSRFSKLESEESIDKSFFTLIKGISIMAFLPGGVRVFGTNFSSEL